MGCILHHHSQLNSNKMTTRIVIETATGKEKIAVYAPNKKGNKQFNVDGKFYTDNEFDKKFITPIEPVDNSTDIDRGIVSGCSLHDDY